MKDRTSASPAPGKLRFGVCVPIDNPALAAPLRDAGCDYVECAFSALGDCPEDGFLRFADAYSAAGLRCERCNGFIPGKFPLLGEELDQAALEDFIHSTFCRAKTLGVTAVVFGSGAARKIPEGMPVLAAYEKLAAFLHDVAGPAAQANGACIAIEPLRRQECNIVHTLAEGALLARLADHPAVGLLGDLFHMADIGDGAADVRFARGILWHAHVACPGTRTFPAAGDGYDYAPFLSALRDAGCPTCSIEAGAPRGLLEDIGPALQALRSAAGN